MKDLNVESLYPAKIDMYNKFVASSLPSVIVQKKSDQFIASNLRKLNDRVALIFYDKLPSTTSLHTWAKLYLFPVVSQIC